MKQLIADSRRRALQSVNLELICLYLEIGLAIVQQQETANWGDAVVEQLSTDLRMAFPDMKGLTKENLFRTRKFFLASREIDDWLMASRSDGSKVATASPQLSASGPRSKKVATVSPQIEGGTNGLEKVATLSRLFRFDELAALIPSISWSHHKEIIGACDGPDERYFYMSMSLRERWSVREVRRQIDAALFQRYVSVKSDPEKCLPAQAEQGDLLPFKDQYTFYVDLLFFHRSLRCLISVDLKKGKFKPEYVGKSRFYCAALDEQIKLPHENPSLGLVLCRSANAVQVRLALTAAAEKVGVATYQTALPDERLIRQRIEQLPELSEDE